MQIQAKQRNGTQKRKWGETRLLHSWWHSVRENLLCTDGHRKQPLKVLVCPWWGIHGHCWKGELSLSSLSFRHSVVNVLTWISNPGIMLSSFWHIVNQGKAIIYRKKEVSLMKGCLHCVFDVLCTIKHLLL